MKKVIAILALISLTGNIASAELLKNFKAGGSIEVNGYQVQNADYNDGANDKINDTESRVTINASFDLNEDVSANVTAIKAGANYDGSANNTAAGDTIDIFRFYETNIVLKGVFGFDHKLGKQFYGEQGDLVVYYGPQGWPYTINLALTGTNSLDGWTGWYETGKWNLQGVYGKDTDTTGAAPDTDQDLTGIVAKYDMSDDMKLGGYLYQYNTQGGAAPHDRLQVLGVKANGMLSGFNYKAEVAKNMGRNNGTAVNTPYAGALTDNSYEGMAFLANASYEMDMAGKLTLMAEYGMGTGDDNATDDKVEAFYGIQSDYRPGLLWGGYGLTGVAGFAGLTNLTTWNVGAKWNPSSVEKLTLKAKLFNFSPTEDAGLAYDTYGMEFDVCANWQHSENVGVKAYYAMFMPESKYSGAATDDSTTMLGAAFNVKF